MRERTLDQVPADCSNLYQSGLAALKRSDVDSAVSFFMQALEIEPGFVACREALRRAERKAVEKRPGFWKRISRNGFFFPCLNEAQILFSHGLARQTKTFLKHSRP